MHWREAAMLAGKEPWRRICGRGLEALAGMGDAEMQAALQPYRLRVSSLCRCEQLTSLHVFMGCRTPNSYTSPPPGYQGERHKCTICWVYSWMTLLHTSLQSHQQCSSFSIPLFPGILACQHNEVGSINQLLPLFFWNVGHSKQAITCFVQEFVPTCLTASQ